MAEWQLATPYFQGQQRMVCCRDSIPVALADGVRDGGNSALLRLILSQFRRLPGAAAAVTMIMGDLKT